MLLDVGHQNIKLWLKKESSIYTIHNKFWLLYHYWLQELINCFILMQERLTCFSLIYWADFHSLNVIESADTLVLMY